MSKDRVRQCVDAQQVLDGFEDWLLRERSVPESTARAYADRMVGFTSWLPAPV
ncbi:hypothetical protein [Prauserella cavernicola]|uniref:Integrase n=1 Tax=Prauserella cavernicola TaxID=2800127 RepID=A0A934QST6_9PSEU|nr:hypothetical protein [Prauserella cavernicola]MBK1785991.1 hypothetical protein [Prauserella cavernicola]